MKGRKNAIILISIFIIAIFIIGNFIYNHYYKIDIMPYTYAFQSRIVDAPDNEHSIRVDIYKLNKDSDISYIMGTVGALDDNKGYSKDVKIIFWQEVDSDSIKDKTIEGTTLVNWIDVVWLDSQTVSINGITLNISNVYDYRRN